MKSHGGSANGRAVEKNDNAPAATGGPVPVGYLTTDSLAQLWTERRRDAEDHRLAHPDDLKGIESRQRVASDLLRTFRLLADLEQQLGIVLGLPVLGVPTCSVDPPSTLKPAPAAPRP